VAQEPEVVALVTHQAQAQVKETMVVRVLRLRVTTVVVEAVRDQ
jgi:hypothetical protein